jgi:hypothetical protein
MFTNCVALWVVDFYLTCRQTFKLFFQECERSDIILDDKFSFSLEYFQLYFLHGVYMELQLDLPLLFISDASMVLIDVRSSQPSDGDTKPANVKLEHYCHDLLKAS